MDLDTFMITVYCCIDDILESLYQGRPLRQRGPKPALSDAEVLTMEVVGEYLGHMPQGSFPHPNVKFAEQKIGVATKMATPYLFLP